MFSVLPVNSYVFSRGNKLKVFNAIIRWILIDMMNKFTIAQRSPQMLLHHISMFTDSLAVNPNMNIPIWGNCSLFALKSALAFTRAKVIGGFNVPFLLRELFAALTAFQCHASLSNLMCKVTSTTAKATSGVCDTALLGKSCTAMITSQCRSITVVLALHTAEVACLVCPSSLKGFAAIFTGKCKHNFLQKKTPFAGQTDVLAEGTLTANKRRSKKHIRFSVFRQYGSLSKCNYTTNVVFQQVVSAWVAYKLAQSRKLYRMNVW